jgi:opacity protein-like surface antigen
MGSVKAFIIAGALAIAAPGLAAAADLLPPPPVQPIFTPPPFSGWYLRGDVGVGIASVSNLRSTFDPGFTVVGDEFDSRTLGDSAFADVGVGYQFNNWFHVDVTGEYRTAGAYHAIESAIFTCGVSGVVRCHDNNTGSVSSAVFLANGYFDIGTWYGFTPFIGAGVGFADNFFRGLTDMGEAGGFGFAADNSSFSFAWAAMAGIGYSVTPNLRLEIGYRHLDMGTATSGAIICQNTPECGHEVQQFHLASNDIRLGMRWIFADFVPPPPVVPLVTKY